MVLERRKGKVRKKCLRSRMTASDVSAKVRVRRVEMVCFDAFLRSRVSSQMHGYERGCKAYEREQKSLCATSASP